MKHVFALILATMPFLGNAQSNPFNSLKYDSVVAYEFQGMGGVLIEDCLKGDKAKISKSQQLSATKVTEIEKLLTSVASYGNTTASCFDPHFGIVYYSGSKVVAAINVCLQCNYLSSTEVIPATSHKMIKATEDYSYPGEGFSTQARKSIHTICTELGFTKYLKPLTSIYD